MQKKNDTTKSNRKWAKVWRVTSQTSFQACSIIRTASDSCLLVKVCYKGRLGLKTWTRRERASTKSDRLSNLTAESTIFSLLIQVKLIHLFLQGFTFISIYFEEYP